MSLLSTILAYALAASSVLTTGFTQVMPQMDPSGTLFLVNRTYTMLPVYVPEVSNANVSGQSRDMRPEAARALEALFQAAKAEKISLRTISGYRSYDKQTAIYKRRLSSGAKAADVNAYVAPPGASEHQLGLAMDVGHIGASVNLTPGFGTSKAGKWLAENSWKYGFIIRYKAGWESVTGYNAEPWHIRYVGTEAAAELFAQNIPFETYIGDLQLALLLSIIEEE